MASEPPEGGARVAFAGSAWPAGAMPSPVASRWGPRPENPDVLVSHAPAPAQALAAAAPPAQVGPAAYDGHTDPENAADLDLACWEGRAAWPPRWEG